MAILFATQGSTLRRETGAFIDLTGDFSVMFWVQILSVPPASSPRMYWSMVNDGGTGYLVLNQPTSLATAFAYVALNAASATINSTSTITYMVPHVWYHLALTYVNSSNTLSLYVNGTLVTSGTLELNATSFNLEQLGEAADGLGNSHSNLAITYYRSFSSALTAAQLAIEMVSETAVVVSPFVDTPLKVVARLEDVSGNGRAWTAVGPIATIDGPVLSGEYGDYEWTNTTAGTARDLGQLPATHTQDVRSGVSLTYWYSYTATNDDVVVGLTAYGDPVNYIPLMSVYDGLVNALAGTAYLGLSSEDQVIQFPVVAGHTYYIKTVASGFVAVGATLVISGLASPKTEALAGSIAVADYSDGFPLSILSSTTGLPVQFVTPFPAAQYAHMLPDGLLMLDGQGALGGSGLFIYDANLVRKFGPITLSITPAPVLISSDRDATFYIGGTSTGAIRVVTVSAETGLQGPTTFTLTSVSGALYGMAPNHARTVLYYVPGGASDNAVRRWDLVNNVALGTFAAIPANYAVIDHNSLLLLADGTLLYGLAHLTSPTDSKILHYSATGTLLNTFNLAAYLTHMWHSLDDPTYVWLRLINDLSAPTGYGEFVLYNITTGSITYRSPNVPSFYLGEALPTPTGFQIIDPAQRFGHSSLGAAWITRVPTYGAPYLTTINAPMQWRLHRLDLKPRKEETA